MSTRSECPECEQLIQYAEEFVELLQHPKYIMEQLRLDDVITCNDADEMEVKSPKRQLQYLRDSVISRKHCHREFADTLKVSNQLDLLKLLSPDEEVDPPTEGLETLRYRLYSHNQEGDPKAQKNPTHLRAKMGNKKDQLVGMKQQGAILRMMTTDDSYLPARDVDMILAASEQEDQVGILIDCIMDASLHVYLALVTFLLVSNQSELSDLIRDEDTIRAAQSVEDVWIEAYFSLLGEIYAEPNLLDKRMNLPSREYIDITLNSQQDGTNKSGLQELATAAAQHIAIEDILQERDGKIARSILFVGHPGTGKSSAMKYIASQVAEKKWPCSPYSPFVPFVIPLRSIQAHNTSLQKLLMLHGPEAQFKEEIWKKIEKQSNKLIIILDGADESQVPFLEIKTNVSPVSDTFTKAPVKDIIGNLLTGKLLPRARILITSRPWGLEQAWKTFEEKVNVLGFNENSLKKFLQTELGAKFGDVWQFLQDRDDIRLLCQTPLMAVSLVWHVKQLSAEEDLLLKNRTDFAVALLASLMKTGDIDLKANPITNDTLWKRKGTTIQKFCVLVKKLLLNTDMKQVDITEEDLRREDIREDDLLKTGLVSKQLTPVETESGRGYITTYIVPHQSLQEICAAVALAVGSIEVLLKVVTTNNGRMDLLLLYTVGLLGNARHHKLLDAVTGGPTSPTNISPDPHEENGATAQPRTPHSGGPMRTLKRVLQRVLPGRKTTSQTSSAQSCPEGETSAVSTLISGYEQNAERVVRAIVGSHRRLLRGGEIFCLRSLRECQQWQLTEHVRDVLGDQLMLNESESTPDDAVIIGDFFHHIPRPLAVVFLAGDLGRSARHLLTPPRGTEALFLVRPNLSSLSAAVTDVPHNSTLCALTLYNTRVVADDMTRLVPASVQALRVQSADLNASSLATLCDRLPTHVTSLDVSGNMVGGSEEDVSGISRVHHTAVTSIRMIQCGLNGRDVNHLLPPQHKLRHVDLGYNVALGREGARLISRALESSDCRLQSLLLTNCKLDVMSVMSALAANSSLTVLVMNGNEVGDTEVKFHQVNNSLRYLSLAWCGLTAPVAAHLARLFQCLYIDLSYNPLHDEFTKLWCELKRLSNLTVLQLRGCGIDDSDVELICSHMRSSSHITEIDVSENERLSCKSVVKLCVCKKLRVVCVEQCGLTGDEWRRVSGAVSGNARVNVVYMGDVGVDMSGCVKALERVFSRVYVRVSEADRESMARCVCEREGQLGRRGWVVVHDSRHVGYVSMRREHVYSAQPRPARLMRQWYYTWR